MVQPQITSESSRIRHAREEWVANNVNSAVRVSIHNRPRIDLEQIADGGPRIGHQLELRVEAPGHGLTGRPDTVVWGGYRDLELSGGVRIHRDGIHDVIAGPEEVVWRSGALGGS
eukprot:1061775-Amorphochlora_amoeboformis.AAC.1